MQALLDRFTRVHRTGPARALIHLPASNRTLTAADLHDRALHIRSVLSGLPLGAGDLLLAAAGNRAGTIPLLLACWAVGVPVLMVDAGTPLADILDLAERFCAAAIVTARTLAEGMGAAPLDEDLAVFPRHGPHPPMLEGAALLKLTSGSTGIPKAIIATDTQLLADVEQIVAAMGIAPDDVQLAAIPLSHSYGFGNLVLPLIVQGTAMVLRESFVPHHVLADARRYGARAFHGVPFMYQYLLAQTPAGGWPPSLSLLVSAGAPLDLGLARSFRQRFGVAIHSFYGASESGGIAFAADDDCGDVVTVGRALPGVTIDLRSDPGVPEGYARVHVRSRAVCAGYVGGADVSDDLKDGGFLTGDYGRLLADGRLMLAGRISTFINVAGLKVEPGEVERVLRTLPGVGDARVLAAGDAVRGERIAAVMAGGRGLTLSDVRSHCAARLAPHKIPRVVVFVEQLPLSPRGKVDYRALDALVRAQMERT